MVGGSVSRTGQGPRQETQFGELLTASRTPIIEINSSYGPTLLRDILTETNGGTIIGVDGEIRLRSGATANGRAHIDTTEAGRYQPGYAAEIGVGIRIPTLPTGNQFARWGGHNVPETDGFEIGVDATGIYVAVQRDSVTTKTYQSAWNVDKLDGTGATGVTLDLSDGSIFQIQFTWYGYGQVHWGIIKVVSGQQKFIPCHSFVPIGATSIISPNIQVFGEANNGGDTSSLDVFVGGRQFSIIGNYTPQYRFSGQNRAAVATSTTAKPLVSFQHKTGFTDRSVKIAAMTLDPASEDVIAEIRIGGTLTGEVWATPTNHTASETAVEADVTATAITGGIVLWSELFVAGAPNKGLADGKELTVEIPVGQVVSLCVRTVSGTGTCKSFFRLQEEW